MSKDKSFTFSININQFSVHILESNWGSAMLQGDLIMPTLLGSHFYISSLIVFLKFVLSFTPTSCMKHFCSSFYVSPIVKTSVFKLIAIVLRYITVHIAKLENFIQENINRSSINMNTGCLTSCWGLITRIPIGCLDALFLILIQKPHHRSQRMVIPTTKHIFYFEQIKMDKPYPIYWNL